MASGWRQAIIVGASSGMGAEIARQLAAQGCRVALVARREAELRRLADEINGRGGEEGVASRKSQVASEGTGDPTPNTQHPLTTLDSRLTTHDSALVYVHDVTCGEEVPGLFQQICRDLGGLDLIVYAAGIQPRITPDEYSYEKDRRIIEINVIGAIAWLNEAAQRFGRAGGGTIVGLSSVAGDRGRRGYPVYCASKAALNTYLEGLRNRVGRFGVAVVTVKPGPVDTPLTKGMEKLPMLIAPETAARLILAAARRRAHTAYIPGKWRFVMGVLRSIPSFLFKKLNV